MTILFEEYIAKVAAQTLERGGSASKPQTQTFLPAVDLWCFPKYPARTAILPSTADLMIELKRFILTNETFWSEPDCWLGTWVNPQTGDYYLDIATGYESLTEAREKASHFGAAEGRQVVALFNPKKDQTIFL